jgi:hypothetical protein
VVLNEQKTIHFSNKKGIRIMSSCRYFVHNRIISAVGREEFVSDRIPYIIS